MRWEKINRHWYMSFNYDVIFEYGEWVLVFGRIINGHTLGRFKTAEQAMRYAESLDR